MNTEAVAAFFDRCAPTWDAEMVRDDRIIGTILDCGGVGAGKAVLDVACGTGVLFPDYLARDVAGITGVDLSGEMVRIASEKYRDNGRVRVLCGNILDYAPEERFDCVMVYNAFPHFFEPERLVAHLAGLLLPGGWLTIAHGMSREKIDRHHQGGASQVSVGLMHEDALAELMGRWLTVTTKLSDSEKYIVTGEKR